MQTKQSLQAKLFNEAKISAKQICYLGSLDCNHNCKTCKLYSLTGGPQKYEELPELTSDMVFAICSTCNNTDLHCGRISMTLDIIDTEKCNSCCVYTKYNSYFQST